ncbi:MAG: glycosyltransferase [Candidatus Omnitrophota bacterium]|nr:glycosyltransferase [Candidatus Omnitrophota bacterium]
MKKILIIYATAGIGHKKAAVAVKKALDEMRDENLEVSIIDALDYTNAFFKWTYLKFYLLMVNRLPTLWGIAYHLTNNFYVDKIVSWLRRFSNWMNSGRLVKYLLEFKPDVIISTHFFASEVISDMKMHGLSQSRMVTIVTDYRLHSWWVADLTDAYVVGSEYAASDLLKLNVPASKIKLLGIPAEPVFSKSLDKSAILNKESLRDGIFTILVIGGGFGIGPIESIIKAINKVSKIPIQAIAVCGHNGQLVEKLKHLKTAPEKYLKVMGFVDNVHEYMEVSDILISKSGGITVAESMARNIPMIIIAPIIGQETRNSDFLVRKDAAVRLGRVRDLKGVLEEIASHPEKLAGMKESIKLIRKPTACYDIARLAVDMCGLP